MCLSNSKTNKFKSRKRNHIYWSIDKYIWEEREGEKKGTRIWCANKNVMMLYAY